MHYTHFIGLVLDHIDLRLGSPFLCQLGSEFFELVRSTAVVEVYSDRRTWQLVGYEGTSFDKGGYVKRGFNDLDWLPDPEAAS